MSNTKMKTKFIILISVIGVSLGTIAWFSSKDTKYYLIDASALAATPSEYSGKNLRVRGFVKAGSLTRKGTKADFILEFENREFPVHFNGAKILPDTFKEGARARVDGRIQNGVLVSDHVETKCASKYEATHENE